MCENVMSVTMTEPSLSVMMSADAAVTHDKQISGENSHSLCFASDSALACVNTAARSLATCSLSDDQNHIYRTCNPFVYHTTQQSPMSAKQHRCAVASDRTPAVLPTDTDGACSITTRSLEQHFTAKVQVVIDMIQTTRSQYIPWSAAAVAVASVAPPA
jgi:hypothetical protein